MKLLILSTVCACVVAQFPPGYRAPYPAYPARARAGADAAAAILRSDSVVNENGYQYGYETQNGIQAQETGVEANGIQAQGFYSYTGDDGQVYTVRYTADGNGFQAQGAHLPTPPPVPEAIARALAQNARDEAAGIFDDGSYRDPNYVSGVAVARAQAAQAAQAAQLAQSRFRQPFYNPQQYRF